LTLQAATNGGFGIVRGQNNNTPTTWHNVHAANGLLSVNRQQVEAVMDNKDIAMRNSINVRAADGCIVGRNENGILVLPFYQVNDESEITDDGLYFINEPNANSP
jgi:hypothetical protein